MSDKNVGMLVELDYCVGCYACQSCCQEANGLPIKETYLRCILAKPERTAGTMHCFMAPVAYDLEQCAKCIDREGGEAPCARICIGRALHFGNVSDLHKTADESPSRTVLFQ